MARSRSAVAEPDLGQEMTSDRTMQNGKQTNGTDKIWLEDSSFDRRKDEADPGSDNWPESQNGDWAMRASDIWDLILKYVN